MREILLKNKIAVFIIAGAVLIASNIYAYKAEFENHLALRDYSVSEQLLYNPEYAEEGYAPDALIREIVRNKTVKVPRELKSYSEYPLYGHLHDYGNLFDAEYFWENNYTKYFMEYASSVVIDTGLPDLYVLRDKPFSDEIKSNFIYLGQGNDMMRYVFLADHTDEEVTTQFYYTYFYSEVNWHNEEDVLAINICTEGLDASDTLIALWDTGENLYLMGEGYFMNNVKEMYQ